jgi:6,7-dimethyl-8-ribityllumazine synthase
MKTTLMDLLHFAMVKGTIDPAKPVLVRVHSECLTGDIFGSMRCDCGPQLHRAMSMMEEEGCGVLLYIRQEGRGIGLVNKIRAYALQEKGLDTVEANVELGFKPDMRNYGIGAQILADLGVRKMRLMTNNPKKMVGIQGYGLSVVEQVPIEIEANEFNKCYLECKKIKMGHLSSGENITGAERMQQAVKQWFGNAQNSNFFQNSRFAADLFLIFGGDRTNQIERGARMPKIVEGKLNAEGKKFAIVASRYNDFITEKLVSGSLDALTRCGAKDKDIEVFKVPGAFEIPLVAKRVAQTQRFDAVICLGAVIQGTSHFDFVAAEASKGIAAVMMETGLPVIFGVITVDTIEQAIERAGTKLDNKGFSAAMAAVEMVNLFDAV